jgi:hypothetical protein
MEDELLTPTAFDVHKYRPCTVPVPRTDYNGRPTIEYLNGEFTGFSAKTGMFHFSLYNGETVKLKRDQVRNVKFD